MILGQVNWLQFPRDLYENCQKGTDPACSFLDPRKNDGYRYVVRPYLKLEPIFPGLRRGVVPAALIGYCEPGKSPAHEQDPSGPE